MIRTTRARISIVGGAVAALVLGTPALAAYAHDNDHDDGRLRTVVGGLDGPRGVATLGGGNTLVSEADGTFSLVIERRHRTPRVVTLGNVASEFAPAIDTGPDGSVYVLTGGAEPGSAASRTAAKLFVWKSGWRKAKVLADIGAYQARDIDPYDLEKNPKDTNPFGVEALEDGTVLVADAAGNDLLRVSSKGSIQTVARLKPRTVTVTVAPWGDVVLSEDGPANQYIRGVRPDGRLYTIAHNRLNHSELTGVCFAPNHPTLFVNIQNPGITINYKTGSEPWLYDRSSAMYELYLRSGFTTSLREAVRSMSYANMAASCTPPARNARAIAGYM